MSALERIDYADGDVALTGWLARPAGTPRGALVVFPTIMNAAPNVERRLPMLAEAGFLVLLADFYGSPVPDRATANLLGNDLRAEVGVFRRRIAAGIAALAGHPERGGLQMGTVGYCMGGQAALEAARMGADLKMAASFHGILSTSAPAHQPIAARMLVCHGDADPLVPREQVRGFQEEMDGVGGNYHLHVYSDVKHGFTDPIADSHGLPALGYNASADRQSWAALMSLCDEVFG